jgi:hypothetical protein
MVIMMAKGFMATAFISMILIAEQLFWKEILGREDIMKLAATILITVMATDIMEEDTERMAELIEETIANTITEIIPTTTGITIHLRSSTKKTGMTPGTKS